MRRRQLRGFGCLVFANAGDARERVQQTSHSASLILQLIVEFGCTVLDDLLHVRGQRFGRQSQRRLRFAALALYRRLEETLAAAGERLKTLRDRWHSRRT